MKPSEVHPRALLWCCQEAGRAEEEPAAWAMVWCCRKNRHRSPEDGWRRPWDSSLRLGESVQRMAPTATSGPGICISSASGVRRLNLRSSSLQFWVLRPGLNTGGSKAQKKKSKAAGQIASAAKQPVVPVPGSLYQLHWNKNCYVSSK